MEQVNLESMELSHTMFKEGMIYLIIILRKLLERWDLM